MLKSVQLNQVKYDEYFFLDNKKFKKVKLIYNHSYNKKSDPDFLYKEYFGAIDHNGNVSVLGDRARVYIDVPSEVFGHISRGTKFKYNDCIYTKILINGVKPSAISDDFITTDFDGACEIELIKE